MAAGGVGHYAGWIGESRGIVGEQNVFEGLQPGEYHGMVNKMLQMMSTKLASVWSIVSEMRGSINGAIEGVRKEVGEVRGLAEGLEGQCRELTKEVEELKKSRGPKEGMKSLRENKLIDTMERFSDNYEGGFRAWPKLF